MRANYSFICFIFFIAASLLSSWVILHHQSSYSGLHIVIRKAENEGSFPPGHVMGHITFKETFIFVAVLGHFFLLLEPMLNLWNEIETIEGDIPYYNICNFFNFLLAAWYGTPHISSVKNIGITVGNCLRAVIELLYIGLHCWRSTRGRKIVIPILLAVLFAVFVLILATFTAGLEKENRENVFGWMSASVTLIMFIPASTQWIDWRRMTRSTENWSAGQSLGANMSLILSVVCMLAYGSIILDIPTIVANLIGAMLLIVNYCLLKNVEREDSTDSNPTAVNIELPGPAAQENPMVQPGEMGQMQLEQEAEQP